MSGRGMGSCRPGRSLGGGLSVLAALGLGLGLVLGAAFAPGFLHASPPPGAVPAAPAAPRQAATPDEFFIVSSIDAARARIVLKRPTEVTLVMRVSERTAYRDEQGKPLSLADLRAGNTVYITYARDAAGEPTAVLVRQGPMTVQELHRRYLRSAAPP